LARGGVLTEERDYGYFYAPYVPLASADLEWFPPAGLNRSEIPDANLNVEKVNWKEEGF
jgi:hypothetical protein